MLFVIIDGLQDLFVDFEGIVFSELGHPLVFQLLLIVGHDLAFHVFITHRTFQQTTGYSGDGALGRKRFDLGILIAKNKIVDSAVFSTLHEIRTLGFNRDGVAVKVVFEKSLEFISGSE